MERRKAEAKQQFHKIKEECKITVEHLNKLIGICASHMDALDRLDSKEHRLNSEYFLTVFQFQNLSYQKIMKLNMELEDYFDNEVPDFQHFREASRASSRMHRDSESSIHAFSPTVNIENDFLKPPDYFLKIEEPSVLKIESTCLPCVEEKNCEELPSVNKVELNNIDLIPDPLATSSILNDTTSTNTELFYDLEDEIENKNIAIEAITEVLSNTNDKISIDDQLDVPEEIVESKENNRPPVTSYISETLKRLPVMTLEEKYQKSLVKPPMPDITLKPSNVKRFIVADDTSQIKLDESDEMSSNDNSNNDKLMAEEEIKVVKKTTPRKSCTFSPEVDFHKHAVFEIDCRPAPLVGDICMVGFAESPSNFYIQVSDENSILIDVIATQLAEINNDTTLLCNTKLEARNQLGKFCTLAIDGTWYRAEVTDWLQNSNSDQVYVQLIDYGSQYSVNYKDLRPLPAFCRSYRLAQKCYLAYLYPPGSTSTNKLTKWPVTCKEAFLNYCGDMDTSDFRIAYIHPSPHERNTYEIDLVRLSEESDDKSIGEVLLEAGLAVQIIDDAAELVKHNGMCNQILAAHGVNGITSEMSQEEILNLYFDDIEDEPSNLNEAIMKYNPRDEKETCRNLRPDGTCYKGPSCKWRHQVLTSGFTNDKQAVYWKAFNELSLPSADTDIHLTISHIVDIQCFYAQIRSELNGITSSINDLINVMNESQMIKKYKKFTQAPALSEIVIAKHWNNYWYRAQVRDVDSLDCKDAMAEVYFVDFGDILEVAVSDLRVIMREFLELPFQAVECRLYNVRHKEDKDPADERRYFESQFLGVTLKAHVVAVPGHLEVLLEDSSGQDVGLHLIEKGFGQHNTEHLFPATNEVILID